MLWTPPSIVNIQCMCIYRIYTGYIVFKSKALYLSRGVPENCQSLRNARNKSRPPRRRVTGSEVNTGLLTLSVEGVVRDADVDKALQDLGINNPKSEGEGKLVSSGLRRVWDKEEKSKASSFGRCQGL